MNATATKEGKNNTNIKKIKTNIIEAEIFINTLLDGYIYLEKIDRGKRRESSSRKIFQIKTKNKKPKNNNISYNKNREG